MIAGYHIEQLLDSGLKGEQYRAHEQASGTPCLVRLIAGNRNSEQFISEAQLATAFFHPNVADVYDAGQLDSGELYVVGEDTQAQTLRELLSRVGTPELLTSVQIARQAAEGVHALHQGGLMHGAICPENITLATDDEGHLLVRLKGIDFGSAIERSIVSNKFLIDSALDSIRYFAPEQFTNDEISPQTDVYGLGIVLYELIAGAPPFDDPKAAGIIQKHKKQPPPELRIDDFELRMLLTHTLSESLQKQPRSRQSSANAFARQLRHMEQLATHTSTPAPAVVVPTSEPKVSAFVSAAASTAKPKVGRPFVPMIAHTESGSIEIEEKVGSPERDDLPWNAGRLKIDAGCEQVAMREQQVETVKQVELPAQENPRLEIAEPEIEIEDISPVVLAQLPGIMPDVEKPAESETFGHSSRLSRLRHKVKKFRSLITLSIVDSRSSKLRVVPETAAFEPVKIEISDVLKSATTFESVAEAGRRAAPKKIDWQQPDDDLPSEEDVLEALLDKPLTAPVDATFEQNVLEVSPSSDVIGAGSVVTPSPKKIEWLTPDDDIPSGPDVLEALIEDPLKNTIEVVSAAPPQPLEPLISEPTVETQPDAIEPENDILSEYVTSELAVDEPANEPVDPVVSERPAYKDVAVEAIATVVAAADTAEVIELQDADDVDAESICLGDITNEEVRSSSPAVRSDVISIKVESEPVAAPMPIKHVDPSQVTNVAVDRRVIGRLVSDEPPTPVRTITRNTREITHLKTVHTTQPTPSVRRVQIQSDPVPIPLPLADLEEITVVRARPVQTRISFQQTRGELPPKNDAVRVVRGKGQRPLVLPAPAEPVERAMLPRPRRPASRNEDPKLIRHNPGNRIRVHTIDLVPSDGILSSYAAPAERQYRAYLIGGGFIALLVLLVLGNVIAYRFVQTDASGDNSSTQTAQKTKQRASKTGPILTVKQIPTGPVDGPVQNVVDEDGVRPSYRERVPLFPERVKPAEIKKEIKNKVPSPKTVSQNIANLPPISSTMVIYSENGRVKSRTEPDYKSTDNRGNLSPSRSTGTSRPRVVKNPKP